MSGTVSLCRYSAVTEREVEWLWFPYIPCGKLTVLQGDPGEGKSTFIINVTALLTRGEPMPDGYRSRGPYRVVYQCAEDDIADMIKPRLIAAGADCDRVSFIQEDDGAITVDDDRIEAAIRSEGAKMLVLDPFQAFLPQDADMQNAQKMRAILRKLSMIAAKTKCAVVLIGHMNKSVGGKNLYRGLGSIDIAAIARSVLMVERDQDEPHIRYVIPIKSSLAPEGPAVAFSLDAHYGFSWLEPRENYSIQESELCTSKCKRTELMLQRLLCDGEMESKEVFNRMEIAGVSRRTVQKAKKNLNIEAIRMNGAWYWRFPSSPETSEEEMEEDDD